MSDTASVKKAAELQQKLQEAAIRRQNAFSGLASKSSEDEPGRMQTL